MEKGEGEVEEGEEEWHKEGSPYIGRGILRTIINDDQTPGQGWGKITGWLPSDVSDFLNEVRTEGSGFRFPKFGFAV